MFDRCKLCGKTGTDVSLIGGFWDSLCNNHRNEFHKFIRVHPVRIEYEKQQIENHYLTLKKEPNQEVMHRLSELSEELFDIAERWVADEFGKREDLKSDLSMEKDE